MTYQNDDVRQAIMQIQQFLRTIQIANGERPTVPIDGIYNEATIAAVRQFQEKSGLPTTGNVDKETYDLLYEKALEAEFEQSAPLPIYIFPKGSSISKGERSDFVILLQIILNELAIVYDDYSLFELDGIFGDKMEDAIRKFQKRNSINETGIVNKATWNSLVTNFNKHYNSQ